MVETARESVNTPLTQPLTTEPGGARKIRDHWSGPPSGRAKWNVSRTFLPLVALKWLVVGMAVVTMLVVAPLIDLVRGSIARLRHLFRHHPFSGS